MGFAMEMRTSECNFFWSLYTSNIGPNRGREGGKGTNSELTSKTRGETQDAPLPLPSEGAGGWDLGRFICICHFINIHVFSYKRLYFLRLGESSDGI